MKFSVTDIISQIHSNYIAKSHLYTVKIVGGGSHRDAPEDIMFNCSAVNVPGINIGFVPFRPHTIGTPKNIATGKNFTEINLSLYETQYEKERQYFVEWMDKIYNKNSKRMGFFKDYVKTVIITQYTKAGERSYECQILEAFPSNISPLDKSYASGDSVSQFNVNIQFSDIKETYYTKTDQGFISWL